MQIVRIKLFQNCVKGKGITLHWALVSILFETRITFEGRVIDQSGFSFLIWLICAESWILSVSIKNSWWLWSEGLPRFVLFNFMYFFTNIWAANFEMVLFIANMANFSIKLDIFPLGMWTITKSTLFCKVLYCTGCELFSFFLKILSILVIGWDLRILWACFCVSSAAWTALEWSHILEAGRSLSWRELYHIQWLVSKFRECWRLLNSHLELNFFNSVTKSWKFWPLLPLCEV